MSFIRPARSSSFSDPDDVQGEDPEAEFLEAELAIREPENAAPTGPVRQWRSDPADRPMDAEHPFQQVWTHDQILDLDDLASYLDYVWEVTRED